MTKPKEAIEKLWKGDFFKTNRKSEEVKQKALQDWGCTCSNWSALLNVCDFLRKEGTGWIQKTSFTNDERTLLFVTGEKPWTDRNDKFVELISRLRGDILILDPYYGIDTFQILSKFPKKDKVLFLTSQCGKDENEVIIKKEIARFKTEFKNIEMRAYHKFYELHDRYIISDNLFIIVGHGIKDIGNKECFLIGLPMYEVKEVVAILREKFEERWKKSNIVI